MKILNGNKFRIIWWHEIDYIYATSGTSGYYVSGFMDVYGANTFSTGFVIPYGTLVTVTNNAYTPSKIAVSFTDGDVTNSAYIRKQWLTNKLTLPKVGDIVKTRQKTLVGRPEIPMESPCHWRSGRNKVILKERLARSPMFIVVKEERGFLQLNTGAWVSCGDVYVPSAVRALKA